MKASIDISMYPLEKNYGTPILEFLESLKTHSSFLVQTNTMSTQIFGDYDELMEVLTREMKTTFLKEDAVVMVLKVFNEDLSPSNKE